MVSTDLRRSGQGGGYRSHFGLRRYGSRLLIFTVVKGMALLTIAGQQKNETDHELSEETERKKPVFKATPSQNIHTLLLVLCIFNAQALARRALREKL